MVKISESLIFALSSFCGMGHRVGSQSPGAVMRGAHEPLSRARRTAVTRFYCELIGSRRGCGARCHGGAIWRQRGAVTSIISASRNKGNRVLGITQAQGSELLKLVLCVGQVKELAVLVA